MAANQRSSEYVTPDGTQFAPYAGFWRRFGGFATDWVLLWVLGLALTAVGFGVGGGGGDSGEVHRTSVQDLFWIPIVAAFLIGYFTLFWARGQSLGMKAVGIRIVNARTGRPPSVVKAAARAFVAVVFVFSALLLAISGFSDAPEGLNAVDLAVLYTSAALFVLGLLTHLWMIWDRKRQTLLDKAAGVVVVGEMTALGADL
ncbi:MAG: RDD family protein [Chloroflexota bacterium]|nr:RDD family protein [Chloroflexota bacterium]